MKCYPRIPIPTPATATPASATPLGWILRWDRVWSFGRESAQLYNAQARLRFIDSIGSDPVKILIIRKMIVSVSRGFQALC